MKKLLPTILLATYCLLFTLIFPPLIKACSSEEVDLLDYYLPDETNSTVEIHHFGEQATGATEYFYTYPATVSNGDPGFYFVKNREGNNFEEFSYDNNYIYRLKDTTWTDTCNGQEAFYTLMDGHLGENACPSFDPDKEGAKWIKRCLKVGETSGPFDSTLFVFTESDCECCSTRNSQEIKKLEYQGSRDFDQTGWHADDLIVLQWPGGGEKYFVDRRYGTVGFEGGGYLSYPYSVHQESHEIQMTCELQTEKGSTEVGGSGTGFGDWIHKDVDEDKTELSPSPPPEPEGGETNSALASIFSNPGKATIQYSKINFPKFEAIGQRFKYALRALLPESIAPVLDGNTTTKITTTATSYKGSDLNKLDTESTADCDSDEPARYEKNLKSKKWGNAALGSVALGFLKPENEQQDQKYYSGENKFNLKIEGSKDYPEVCKKPGFGPGDDTPKGSAPKPNNFDTEAYIKTLWEKIKEWIDENFLKTEKEKKSQNRL